MKNSTMVNSQNIKELNNEFMESVTHQAMSKMERQIGQLANHLEEREKGKFPSQLVPNPKGQFVVGSSPFSTHGQEHMHAITTLR